MTIKCKLIIISILTLGIYACNSNGSSSQSSSNHTLNSLLKSTAASCSNLSCQPGIYYIKDALSLTNMGMVLESQQQQTNQFSNNHYAILVAPGTYNMVDAENNARAFNLGYYTQILGVGKSMADVTLNPGVEVYNQGGFLKGAPSCFTNQSNPLCLTVGGLNNFWRGVENFTMQNNRTNPDHSSQILIFAVSQASPIRSIDFKGSDVLLCDYHAPGGCGYTSGGFMANSIVENSLIPGSQQQWISRNSNINSAQTAIWNSVNLNDTIGSLTLPSTLHGPRQPTDNSWAQFPLAQANSSITKEKPYISCTTTCNSSNQDDIQWKVEVPQVRVNAVGINTTTPQELDVASNFIIVSPTMGVTANNVTTLNSAEILSINQQLKSGKSLLITPGTYNLDGGTINVTNNNTIILGLGLPDLVCTSGKSCINVSATEGVDIAGLTFDAGYKLTPSLLQIGSSVSAGSSGNPIFLHDVFFRIAETQLETRVPGQERQTIATAVIYTGNVIGDNLWIWRADHDKASSHSMTSATSNLVNWSQDKAQYGLIVYGDNVTMNGLAVEHFQDYQTVWYGNNGNVNFYQSEMPYDVPSLNDWICTNPKTGATTNGNGCASYVVDASVTSHNGNGLGVYTFFANAPIMAKSAFLVPNTLNGIELTHLIGKWLTGNPESGYKNLVANYGNNTCWGYGVQAESDSIYASSYDYSILGAVNNSAAALSACN